METRRTELDELTTDDFENQQFRSIFEGVSAGKARVWCVAEGDVPAVSVDRVTLAIVDD
ncbi:hypothetical protein [Rhodococcus jostii]|uniref:hypothetical protein n=1 Tax=Rhodococcus jostii TaxID=132919 RepID=UPI00364652E7